MRRFLFISLWSLAAPLVAGPVNTPGSYPFAKANSRGDRLTLGDLKSLVYWQDRAAALKWKTAVSSQDRFSGGLAEADLVPAGKAVGIACAAQQTQIYHPERSPAAPAGYWQDLGEETGKRRCAMQRNGSFAELFGDRALLVVDRSTRLSLPAGFQNAELVAAGGGFMLLNAAGQGLSIYLGNGQWRLSAPWKHTLTPIQGTTRIAGNDRFLLRSDPDGNTLVTITGTLDGARTQPAQRLTANPCEEEQACGLSLAEDDSWVLSGYWGHYLGRGLQFMRLNIPLSVDKGSGAVAIAHASEAGRFIYLGFDDGDQGTLPGLPILAAEREAIETVPDLWMIWKKVSGIPMEAWKGPLPETIPSDWLAWEPAYSFTLQTESPRAAVADDRWWLDRLEARAAQALAAQKNIAGAPVHAAVIDSGIDPTHPLLMAQLDRKPQEIPGNGLDDDGNGYVDDVWGYDFVEEDAVPQDLFGHGTHVAGLLSGQYPNDIRSPAPNLRLMVVRALDRAGKSNSVDLARALLYAADNGAEIVNCSWGGGPDTQALRDAFAILRQRGVVVFSSAGNDKLDTDKNAEVPKKYPGVTSVAATDKNNGLASFSSYGKNTVRFMAPGDAIVSSVPGGTLGEKSGTSMASPLAAASFAYIWGLIRTLHPDWTRAAQIAEVDRLLCASADPKGVEGRSQCGRLSLLRAVQSL